MGISQIRIRSISWFYRLAALVLVLLSGASHAVPLPVPFTAHYTLSKGIIDFGRTTRSLKLEKNGEYLFESDTEATGMFAWLLKGHIRERSYWRYKDGNVIPEKYIYERTGKKKRHVELTFDWDKLTVINNINSDPWQMDIKPGTLDKLVYQVSLMLDLKQGKREFFYHIADGGKLKTYHIVTLGEEDVETPIGTFKTVKVTRADDKHTTILWCAEQLSYLPVKIEYSEDDDGPYTALIESLEGIPLP
jgi:hypothetical protein